jgi:hypothetical protein
VPFATVPTNRLLSRLAAGIHRYVRFPKRQGKVSEEKLISSINESARGIGAQSLTLFVTAAYIAISAAGVTDQSFILQDRLSLPVVNANIPVESFFLLAPALLLILHLTVLLQEYFLLQKLSLLPARGSSNVRAAQLYPSISLSSHFPREHWFWIGILVRLIFVALYFVIPLAVLVYLQMSSLRYRVDRITDWLWVCTVIDLVSVLGFIGLVDVTKSRNPIFRGHPKFWAPKRRFWAKAVVLTAVVTWLTTSYIGARRFS